jgi:hypothetical protein
MAHIKEFDDYLHGFQDERKGETTPIPKYQSIAYFIMPKISDYLSSIGKGLSVREDHKLYNIILQELKPHLNESQLPGAPPPNDAIETLKNPDPDFQRARYLVKEYLREKSTGRMGDLPEYLAAAPGILDTLERNIGVIIAAMKEGMGDNKTMEPLNKYISKGT